MQKTNALALRDLTDGLAAFQIWGRLAWHDIKQRYRRSILGPFWLTLSAAIFIGAVGVLYAAFFNQEPSEYLPYLAIGVVVWTLLATSMNESCMVFVQTEQIMKQVKLPLTTHVCRMLWRNVLIFLHNFMIVPVVIVATGKGLSWHIALLPVCFLLILWNCLWSALILGIVCARFRDIPQIVANLVQLAFFLSPIMWVPSILGERQWIAQYNPVFHLLELFRAPLLDARIPVASLMICLLIALVGSLLCLAMLARYRHRVPYWI
jgi:homopolymeric O-antigen transport system permease protein